MGRDVALGDPAMRVVSLVPSETLTVADLAGVERLIGRTEYCIEPHAVQRVPIVGGTKNVELDAVVALCPDLVLANQEENTRRDVEKLIAAGLRVHVSFPKTVRESDAYVGVVAALLGVAAPAARDIERPSVQAVRVFVPIWNDPLMTFDEYAFASDVIALAGGENVFAGRSRRYPLARDLSPDSAQDGVPRAHTSPGDDPKLRDTRYPRIRLEEVVTRDPDVILLPDEPYRFTETDASVFKNACPRARVLFADGKDLFWYGTRAHDGVARVRALLTSAS